MAVISSRAALAVVCGMVVQFTALSGDAGGRSRSTEPLLLDTDVRGALGISADGLVEERFRVPEPVLAVLGGLEPGISVRIRSWPVAPGDHRAIRLERRSVYAAGARLFEVGEHGLRALPRSPRIHFFGAIEDEADSGVLLVLDPRSGQLSGVTVSQGLSFDLEASDPAEPRAVRVVASHERTAALDPSWDCGGDRLELPDTPRYESSTGPGRAEAKSGGTLEAVVAIDTDTELLSQKFGNSTAAAADYIADLFAAMNVMYERDLDLRLLQGTTYLRTGSDPYVQNSGGSASGAELNEFGNYWKTHYQSVDRALAAMLSGKSPSSNSASGIAWIGGLCSSTYGYSFSKVFKINYLSGDAKIVGHELGHNFGSPHTHCYSPPIDQCISQGGSCYSGPTSCPGGPGTVMSYCHLVGCGSTLNFHPTAVNRILDNYVTPATGLCVFAASQSGGGIFADGFENGMGGWSASVP